MVVFWCFFSYPKCFKELKPWKTCNHDIFELMCFFSDNVSKGYNFNIDILVVVVLILELCLVSLRAMLIMATKKMFQC